MTITDDTARKLEIDYVNALEELNKLKDKIANIRSVLVEYHEEHDVDDLDRITIYHIPSRTTVQWKSVAEELKPPEELIEKYSKKTAPSYGIRLKKQPDNK